MPQEEPGSAEPDAGPSKTEDVPGAPAGRGGQRRGGGGGGGGGDQPPDNGHGGGVEGKLTDLETLQLFFKEFEPDQSGKICLNSFACSVRDRTGVLLSPEVLGLGPGAEDARGGAPSGSGGEETAAPSLPPLPPAGAAAMARPSLGEGVPVEQADGSSLQRTRSLGSRGDGAAARGEDKGPLWPHLAGLRIDFVAFRRMIEGSLTDDEELSGMYRTFVYSEGGGGGTGEARTPPAMERNLFLSALANGKLMHHRDDILITLKRILAGGLAGMLAKSVVAPVDRVKILFQVTNERFSFAKARGLTRDILRVEGVLGLWRGNSATMIRVFPYAGTQFMMFDTLKRRLLAHKWKAHGGEGGGDIPFERQRLSNFESLISGSVAGATSAFVTYPLDLARARLAVGVAKRGHTGLRHRKSVFKMLGGVVREEGIPSLYRGVLPSLLGIIPYAGIAFSINEWAKHEVCILTGREPGMLHKLGIGAFAGLVAQSCTYPLEVVRRRMQTQGLVDQHAGVSKVFSYSTEMGARDPAFRERLNIFQTVQVVVQEQGLRGLFKGLSMNWVKGPVGISISFTTFDFLKRRLDIQ